jgi:hypothetical protein
MLSKRTYFLDALSKVDTGPPTTAANPTENRNFQHRCQSPKSLHPHPKNRENKNPITTHNH